VALASRLRRAGLRVEQVLEPMRLGKQIRFADRKGIPYVAILGPDELAAGKLVLKNLKTGEQQAYSEAEAVAHLQGWG
jgi:histidyl-tRNA synthetase